MKKLFYSLIIMSAFVFTACEKETANISRITFFPTITLNGDQWNTVDVGGSFTDPGVVAKEGETTLVPTIGGDAVNTSVPGVYVITYTAVNKDGYSATEYRYVGVVDPALKAIDLTGNYKRNAGAQGVSKVTRISPAFYSADNVGGIAVGGPATTVYFYHYAPGKLGVPLQLVVGSPFYCDMTSVEVGVKYAWRVINSGYGTAVRTFIKQ